MVEPILCYVDGKFAFFTTQSLEDQTGDDWNDRPWHSNAGDPYLPREGDNWQIVQIGFDTGARTPESGSVDDEKISDLERENVRIREIHELDRKIERERRKGRT